MKSSWAHFRSKSYRDSAGFLIKVRDKGREVSAPPLTQIRCSNWEEKREKRERQFPIKTITNNRYCRQADVLMSTLKWNHFVCCSLSQVDLNSASTHHLEQLNCTEASTQTECQLYPVLCCWCCWSRHEISMQFESAVEFQMSVCPLAASSLDNRLPFLQLFVIEEAHKC